MKLVNIVKWLKGVRSRPQTNFVKPCRLIVYRAFSLAGYGLVYTLVKKQGVSRLGRFEQKPDNFAKKVV